MTLAPSGPIYLHLIFDIFEFEISSLMNWIFFWVWTGFLNPTQAVKIEFKLCAAHKNFSQPNVLITTHICLLALEKFKMRMFPKKDFTPRLSRVISQCCSALFAWMRGWDTMLCYNSFDKIDSWQNLALYLKTFRNSQ